MSRCMAYPDMQKYDTDQRAAICHSMYKEKGEMKNLNAGISKALKGLQIVIEKMERQEIYKSVLNEIPVMTLNLFSPSGQMKFKDIYLEKRLAGGTIEDSLDVTGRLVIRSFKDNRLLILKGIQKELKQLLKKKSEFYAEETNPENWGPNHDEINDTGSFDDQLDEEKIDKAEEGQKKMIFGKPFTFSGGKWVPDEGGGSSDEENTGEGRTTEQIQNQQENQEMINDLKDRGFTDETINNMTQQQMEDAYFSDLHEQEKDPGEVTEEDMINHLEDIGFSQDEINEMTSEEISDKYWDDREFLEEDDEEGTQAGAEWGDYVEELKGMDEEQLAEEWVNFNINPSYDDILAFDNMKTEDKINTIINANIEANPSELN